MFKRQLVFLSLVAVGAVIALSVYNTMQTNKTRRTVQKMSAEVALKTNLRELNVSTERFEIWRKSLSKEENQRFLSLANIVHSPYMSKEKLSPVDKVLVTRAIQEAVRLKLFDRANKVGLQNMDLQTRNVVWDLNSLRRLTGLDNQGY